MCGIFGIVLSTSVVPRAPRTTRAQVAALLELSASRGKEAVGLAISSDRLDVYKEPISAERYVRTSSFRHFVDSSIRRFQTSNTTPSLAIMGHSRLVTDGGRDLNRNNQPVISSGTVGIHNGIIVNHAQLWARHPTLKREFEVDSEVIFALIRKELSEERTLEQACGHAFDAIEGAASVAALFEDREQLLLATNNGSLYYRCQAGKLLVFASERFILDSFVDEDERIRKELGNAETEALRAGEGVVVDLPSVVAQRFQLAAPPTQRRAPGQQRKIVDTSTHRDAGTSARPPAIDLDRLADEFPYRFPALRRCSRCVLPYTMPYIEFDAQGVCNYCHAYRAIEYKGRPALEELIERHPASSGRPRALISVSGGRDSIYGMHYLKEVLGLDVISYTYDWGMVTDLARRNISRACGRLGIENILVSADIASKRNNIRKNVEAWLERPALGAIPLFMAGDKAYFHHLRKVQSQTRAPLSFLCENLLERTNFKTGFAGVPPQVGNKEHSYSMQASGKLGLASYFLGQFARNRSYINASLVDTASAFVIYYLQARTDHNLFSYVRWREDEVVPILRDQYDFELSPDTETTWRIGDGTAAFYNYIYFTVAGFTENDTFRSNQVREGDLTRDEALQLVERDNRYRLPSVKWYLDTIGTRLEMQHVLATIHAVPKLYSV